MKPVLDVHVITTDAVQLDAGPAGSVVMIPFHGTVTGTVFDMELMRSIYYRLAD